MSQGGTFQTLASAAALLPHRLHSAKTFYGVEPFPILSFFTAPRCVSQQLRNPPWPRRFPASPRAARSDHLLPAVAPPPRTSHERTDGARMTESDSPLTIPECDLVNLVLSRTSAGACLRGSCRADGRRVSVRLLCVTSGLDRWWKEHVQDLLLVRQLRSERLLVPLGLYRAGPQVGLVLEWMQEGSLHTLLHETQLYPELPIPLRLRILLDVAEGLSHLHAIALPHLALRPTNVLLDTQYRAKVCDWGLQWTQSSGSAVSAGCMPYNRDLVYMSPELLQGKPPSLQADVYSFGMMLLQTLNRRLPSKDTCSLKIQQSHAICWPGTGTEPLDHALKHLIVQSCSNDPQSRPAAADKHLITQHASEETASSVLQSFGRLRSQSVPEYQQQNETGRASFQQGSSPLPTPTLPMGFRHGRHNVPLCFLPGPSCCRILQERREAIVRGMTEGRLNNLLDVLRSRKALSQEEYELITAALTLAARTRSLLDTCLCLGEGVARLVAFTLGLVSTPTIHGPSRLSY
ncbi:receptor-interacting serine/threonine-protein kinase 2 [Scleropages formosus]|uniref:receptor-interacting serine/threonine-protein kinase 2 n=1 Tax=Scleropages formosus TaxID=113540 RepID=UPI0010FA7B66|nr:receptor-interacting serine/threonine-protein kinase 2-like [Scleropages formosus]